jgi:hypothetical protein
MAQGRTAAYVFQNLLDNPDQLAVGDGAPTRLRASPRAASSRVASLHRIAGSAGGGEGVP